MDPRNLSMIPDREREADCLRVEKNGYGNAVIYKRYTLGDQTRVVQVSLTPSEAERIGEELSRVARELMGGKGGK